MTKIVIMVYIVNKDELYANEKTKAPRGPQNGLRRYADIGDVG